MVGSADVHPLARAFDTVGPEYERGRPDYPPEAVQYLAEVLGLGPGRTVVDLGSGTGKFTRALRPLGSHLLAIEPSEGMRAVFRSQLPDVEVRDGSAEAIPLPDASADAVVVAQAFHWFRQPAALDEIARVLRPDGGLGLVWNRRDSTVPWVGAFGEILDTYDAGHVPRTHKGAWKAAFETHPHFAPPELKVFTWTHEGDVATFVDRALSVSFIASQPPEARARVAEAVRTLLAEHPDTKGLDRFQMPYRTHVHSVRRH
ncbi:MAG: class I SAM-dependent methyltransferase [Thermoplasmata archaeon]|nr:class I SAM-dependent methyltransferase [Thermoplasmata archaeon]MCI4361644.1 class I SAM-dependent methyltransferase [Thermoplasmata archaeon]